MQINRSTFSILFYLNTSKKKKSGKCPLVGRITVDGKSTAFSTGLELLPEQWDSKQGLATGKSKEETDINKQIKQRDQRAVCKKRQCSYWRLRFIIFRKEWLSALFMLAI